MTRVSEPFTVTFRCWALKVAAPITSPTRTARVANFFVMFPLLPRVCLAIVTVRLQPGENRVKPLELVNHVELHPLEPRLRWRAGGGFERPGDQPGVGPGGVLAGRV